MAVVEETIPDPLRPEVDAALAWFNRDRGVNFEATGIIDPDASIASRYPRDLRLVLCGGDVCEQRTFRVSQAPDGFSVALQPLDDDAGGEDAVPAELDPPPGARRSWLDRALSQHEFVVLVFYRGFW